MRRFKWSILIFVVAITCAGILSLPTVFAATGTISANPNPVYVPFGQGVGTTTITWSSSGTTAQVWVSMDGGSETLFAQAKSGSQQATWIQPAHAYVFKLYDGTGHTTLLASVTVNGLRPTGTISANPWTDVTMPPGQLGTVTITWSTQGCTQAGVWVRMDGGTLTNMTGGTSGQASPNWIQDGHYYDFYLYDGTGTTNLLAQVRIYGRATDYKVGVCYHAFGSDFATTAFLSQYNTTYNGQSVRTIVQGQLQGMANRGASTIKFAIWMIASSGNFGPTETWKSHFPPSAQELANLRQFAQDVAAIQATDGHRLRLDISMGGLWAADYQVGSPSTTLGMENLTAAQFLGKWTTGYQTVVNNIYDITRPDGVKVADVVYLEGEVMIGAKTNEDWFLQQEYPAFVTYCNGKGIAPAVYFLAAAQEAEVLDNGFTDGQYPILNGHRSMYWIYRSMKFLKDNSLYIPPRTDFSCYPGKVNSTYQILIQRIFDDADATLPSLTARKWYGAAETYYLADNTQREALGDAWCAQRLINNRVSRVEFWTTPDGGGSGVHMGYPFEIEDYLP